MKVLSYLRMRSLRVLRLSRNDSKPRKEITGLQGAKGEYEARKR